MWPFKPREENIENLTKDCNKLYSSFNQYLGLAHYQSYFDLKKLMGNNFQIMKYNLGQQHDEDVVKALLLHFKAQLQFFETHPFSCNSGEFLDFEQKNFPYQGKIELLIQEVKNSRWKAHETSPD